MLNRTITWERNGISWRADKRHAESIIEQLGLQGAHGVAAPSEETIRDLRRDGVRVDDKLTTHHRSVIARANYLSLDRADTQFTTRTLSKMMSAPTEQAFKHLRHLGRYLCRVLELEILFHWSEDIRTITVQSDSDWAGDRSDRRSVTGGAAYMGGGTC